MLTSSPNESCSYSDIVLRVVLIFSLQQLLPGDPAMIMAGEDRDPAVIEQIRKQYRLDQPFRFNTSLGQGRAARDLGESDAHQASGAGSRACRSFPSTDAACVDGYRDRAADRHHAGVISAVKKDTVWDYAANVFALWGLSTPNFCSDHANLPVLG